MSFESPLMFLFFLALALPIWLHFRKSVENRIAFPSVSVLHKVTGKLKKRIELKQKILLALRILFIAVTVLAVSRPGVSVTRPGGIRAGAELGLVLILDDSFSMRGEFRANKTVFDIAKELALVELNRLRPGDGAALILSGSPVRTVFSSIELDLADVRRQVEDLTPSYLRGDLASALVVAQRILLESPLPQREVLVITDRSKDTLVKDRRPWAESERINLRIIDAAKDFKRENVAVDQIKVRPSPQGETREVIIEARIANYSQSDKKNFDVMLEVDEAEVARGSIDVPAGQSAVKAFHHRFTADGVHRGIVRIKRDNLPGDDLRHFSVTVRQSIAALVIDGDYRPGSYKDEAFYLHRALEIPMPGEVPIQPVVVDVDTARTGTLTGNEVLFLAGVQNLVKEFADRIIDYVKKGGGVFVSPGSKGSALNQLESILPAKVRSVRQSSKSGRPFRIAAINRSHPVFLPFGNGSTGLEKTQIESHLLVEPEPDADKTTLIELTNGLPLLMERRVGAGRVMLLATTVDRDWTDLPIRPGYFPLIQRSARHLSGRLNDTDAKRIYAGRSVDIEVTQGMQRLLIRSPDGKDTVYSAAELSGKSSITYNATSKPGHYRIWAEIPMFGGLKELETLEFVVEVDPAESDTRQVMETLKETEVTDLAPIKGSLPVWPYLLIALVLLLFAETWLGSYGLRESHAKGRSEQ